MNAIELLIKEHNKVRELLAEIEAESQLFKKKINLFNKLSNHLIQHEIMEHKVWYPHFKNDSRLKEEVKHLLKEEDDAEQEIKKLNAIEDEKEWNKQFIQFKKNIQHHAAEEEQLLFPEVKQILDENELNKIGKLMREFKEQYFETQT